RISILRISLEAQLGLPMGKGKYREFGKPKPPILSGLMAADNQLFRDKSFWNPGRFGRKKVEGGIARAVAVFPGTLFPPPQSREGLRAKIFPGSFWEP
ncbi:MAG: hypothetical protein ACKO23_18380, partial [Gemmataceae bacterium]